ncbi:unnamed protein product, partial [Ectocarpus sp. 12 AP-2014]
PLVSHRLYSPSTASRPTILILPFPFFTTSCFQLSPSFSTLSTLSLFASIFVRHVHIITITLLPPIPSHLPLAFFQNMARYKSLLAAMNNTNTAPEIPPATIYRNIVTPSKGMSFDVISAQQTLENMYLTMARFTASGPIFRKKCGMGSPACNSTCNPPTDLPISCNNKVTPHL